MNDLDGASMFGKNNRQAAVGLRRLVEVTAKDGHATG
jgi:hypothetical protein